MKFIRHYTFSCLLILIFSNSSFCQSIIDSVSISKNPSKRKTVGLVLSGGGAKGIAHVGVIKVLEENGIPIDYIAGTSMGAIVGGFYAAGYTSDELESFMRDPKFQVWVSGQIDPNDEFYFGRQERGAEWINFNIELDSNYAVSWNPTIVKDASLNYALSARLYKASYKANYNFDSLSIPFRCVGSDIFERKAVTIKEGQLERAIRASMAVPLAFRPIKIDGKYLFDGGVYNNIPIDVMKEEFAPDMVIAVNLGAHDMIDKYPYDNADEMVKGNVLKYIIMNNTYPKEDINLNKDVYLGVPVDDFSSADFTPVDTLISIGEEYTQSQIESILKVYGEDQPKVQPKKSEYNELFTPNAEEITHVDLGDNLTFNQRLFLRNIIKPNRRKNTSIDELLVRYNMLISNNYFSNIDAYFYYDSTDLNPQLHLDVTPNKKIRVGVGGNIASRNIGQAYINGQFSMFGRSLNTFRVNAFAGAFYSSVKTEIESMYAKHIPFSVGAEFILNRWNYANAQELIFEPQGKLNLLRADNYAGLKGSFATGRKGKFTAFGGYFWNEDQYDQVLVLEDSSSNQTIPLDLNGSERLKGWTYGIEWETNTLNAKTFPTRGRHIKVSAKNIQGVNDFDIYIGNQVSQTWDRQWFTVQAKYEQYFPLKFMTVGARAHLAYSNYEESITVPSTIANSMAYYPLIDSKSLFLDGFRSPVFAAGGLKLIKKIWSHNLSLQLEGHVFHSHIEYTAQDNNIVAEKIENDFFDLNNLNYAAAASVVYKSPIGPLSLSLNHYNEEDKEIMVLFNLGIIIYNKKILEE